MPKREWSELLWWTERDVHGMQWPVILTSDDLNKWIVRCDGRSILSERIVYIWAGQNRAGLLDTVCHELAHVHSWASQKRVNEQSIRNVVPQIVPMLARQGWSPPALPAGYRSLQAHARYVRHGKAQREAE